MAWICVYKTVEAGACVRRMYTARAHCNPSSISTLHTMLRNASTILCARSGLNNHKERTASTLVPTGHRVHGPRHKNPSINIYALPFSYRLYPPLLFHFVPRTHTRTHTRTHAHAHLFWALHCRSTGWGRGPRGNLYHGREVNSRQIPRLS